MEYRYRAFLSYSHKDAEFAARFHKDLESWRAGRGLVGRETPEGPVPPNLRPIFRDRDDFAGGGTLSEATGRALRGSKFLIVLCSPDAARSAYVNEEIRLFRTMGRSQQIIPVIIAGEPGHADDDCFPRALVHRVGPDGQLAERIDEPLAADARDRGDGPRRALAKVIAGLLSLPFDEIVRRGEQAQRRRTRIYIGVAAAMFCLALAAGIFARLAETRRVTAERNYHAALDASDSLLGDVGEELIRTEGIRLETTRRLIARSESIYDQLMKSLPDARELQFRKAAALAVFAKAFEAKGDRASAMESLDRALALTEKIVSGDPGNDASRNLQAMLEVRKGTLLASSGRKGEAIALMRPAVARLNKAAVRAGDKPDLAWEAASGARMLSLLLSLDNDLGEAKALSQNVASIAGDWRRRKPNEMRWLMLVALSDVQTGMLRDRAGDTAGALASYDNAKRILEQNVKTAPDMAQLRVMLVQVLDDTAALQEKAGDATAAATTRRRAVEITHRLATADAENENVRVRAAAKDVAAAVALLAKGERAVAIPKINAALTSLAEGAADSPGKSHAGLVYWSALEDATRAFGRAGLYRAAESRARELLKVREDALSESPDDDLAKAAVARALGYLASAVDGQGQPEKALDYRRRELAIENGMTGRKPGRRRHLAWVEKQTGLLLWRLSRRKEAEPYYGRQAALLEALWKADPSDGALGLDLAQAWLNLGELRALNGDGPGARVAFARCLEIGKSLLDVKPDAPQRLIALAWAEARMAELGDRAAARWRRVEALLVHADRIEPLGDQEDELLTVARISQTGAR